MTADFRNDQLSSLRNKANVIDKEVKEEVNQQPPELHILNKVNDPIVEPDAVLQLALNSYEEVMKVSDGNLQKRLFICAQLFFTASVSTSDIE